jgi:RNA polymerase sigma-70 factor (ECF subfamily)
MTSARSLLDRLGDGHDSPAWSEFVRLYTPLLQYWLRPHLLQSADADDVVQDVLVVVLAKLPEFKPAAPGAFRAWLRAILSYRLQTFWRKRLKGHAVGAFDGLLAGLSDPGSELSRAWDEEHDRHVVGGLLDVVKPRFQPTTWQAFWRTAILEEQPADVAKALRITPNAVFIARSRVMQRLREEATGLVDEG